MPTPRQRSRSLRKVFKKLPGGRIGIHYTPRKPQRAHCAFCGAVLPGVAYGTRTAMRKLAKTQRRPERPYGGTLCSRCTRETIITKTRREHHA